MFRTLLNISDGVFCKYIQWHLAIAYVREFTAHSAANIISLSVQIQF